VSALDELLARLKVASPFPFPVNARRWLKLDLSGGNAALRGVAVGDPHRFGHWLADQVAQAGADYAGGGYGEDRALYEMSPHFRAADGDTRTIHLGIDLWLQAGTPIHAVHAGRVHSTADNAAFGDYGPTIVLEHRVDGRVFHTLYGHLSRDSLRQTRAGEPIRTGELIGWLGEPTENVGWPPHLHFQVIRDLDGRRGDYPGVCLRGEADTWLERCPDPNLLLRIETLHQS
jgi:murein DD-endopeptidase MepM/ murein hydrolase activator NlpD